MKRLIAVFLFAIGTVFLLGGALMMLKGKSGSMMVVIFFPSMFYAAGYIIWPVEKKKKAIDYSLGSVLCLFGAIGMIGLLGRFRTHSMGVVIFNLLVLLAGVGLLLKRGAKEVGLKTSNQPPQL